jgi:glutathione peroxidase
LRTIDCAQSIGLAWCLQTHREILVTDAIYSQQVETLSGKPKTLEEHRGEVLLIVNTASECGFTPQFGGLESLYEKYKDRGFTVLGFPCNQFGGQEPGTAEEANAYCQRNYGVTFPMHGKVEVNGENAHPLFRHLKKEARGVLGTEAVKWNFTKFLVDRKGNVIERFAPQADPESLASEIEKVL